jgi:lysophospholipase L1-like esterase
MRRIATSILVCLVAAGCGSDGDPFADDTGGGADASAPGGGGGGAADAAPGAPDAAPEVDAAPLSCATLPDRLVVLGDSITACSNVGGKMGTACGPRLLHDYLASDYRPAISYENLAVPGAVTSDVPDNQLGTIDTGAQGHLLVLIYIGGNDLQPYIFISDGAAQSRFDREMPEILDDWDQLLDFFDDTTRFPDGVTVMMNTQYNPFDDCTASPYNLSQLKTQLLHQFNDNLAELAASRDNVVITDQHASYLGHGHHYDDEACPHYMAGAEPWMDDLIHPNEAGHRHLADEWAATADRLYRDCQ